jgi:hypothetical protein
MTHQQHRPTNRACGRHDPKSPAAGKPADHRWGEVGLAQEVLDSRPDRPDSGYVRCSAIDGDEVLKERKHSVTPLVEPIFEPMLESGNRSHQTPLLVTRLSVSSEALNDFAASTT